MEKALDEVGVYKKDYRTIKRFNATKRAYIDLLNGGSYSSVVGKLENGAYSTDEVEIKYVHNEAVDVYKDAKRMLVLDFEMDKPNLKEQLYAYLQSILGECREKGDRYNAIQAVNSIAKLVGITDTKYQTVKVESEGPVTIKFGFDDNDGKKDNNITNTEYEEVNNDGT